MPHQRPNLVYDSLGEETERRSRLIRLIEGQIVPRLLIALSTAHKEAAERLITSVAGDPQTKPEAKPGFSDCSSLTTPD